MYAPTSDYDYNEIEEFYDQLQNVIDQTPKKDDVVVQGDGNAKVGKDACGNCWRTLLVLTRHPEDGPGIVQMDNTTARLIIF